MIVSNPPYVPSGDLENLPPEVKAWEPREALDGGEEGMFYIKKIIIEATTYLKPGGWLLLEVDPEQASTSMSLIEAQMQYHEGRLVKDYSHQYRVIMAKRGHD